MSVLNASTDILRNYLAQLQCCTARPMSSDYGSSVTGKCVSFCSFLRTRLSRRRTKFTLLLPLEAAIFLGVIRELWLLNWCTCALISSPSHFVNKLGTRVASEVQNILRNMKTCSAHPAHGTRQVFPCSTNPSNSDLLLHSILWCTHTL